MFTLGKYKADAVDYLHWSTEYALKNAAKIIFITVVGFLIAQILMQGQGVEVVLQGVKIGLHGLTQVGLVIIIECWSQIIRFPVHQIKPVLMLKNQIDVTLHKAPQGSKFQFFQIAGKSVHFFRLGAYSGYF